MALSKETLSGLIETKIKAKKGDPDDPDELKDFCDAIADAVVSHILAAAVVTTTIVGTVNSGAGAGGAVTGTGTGTVS